MFTTALAMAEVVGNVSGRELLTAAAAGYELCFRVGVVTWKGLGNRGYNRTGTLGTMGAAATAAKILGLDEDRIKDAIGIAGVYASGLQSSRLSMSKRATQGRAAQQGVLGAFLAQKGFTGSDVIEASFGICDTLAGESDLSKLKDIGKTFTIHNIGFKPYTAATGIHKGLDALQKLMKSYPIDPNRVEKVIFRMPIEAAYLYMGNDPEHIKPWTIEVALYSIHYAAACMLIDGEMFIDQLNEKRIKDPRILELAMKVEITPTPELAGKGTIVEVVQGGHTYKSEPVYYSKGMPQNPMSKDELRQKFKKLARTVFQDDKIEEIVKTVENMEQIEDVAILAEKLTNIP
jgi:2-methylcitrate dehydratase PrpD